MRRQERGSPLRLQQHSPAIARKANALLCCPILVTAHSPKAHPALRFALLSPQVQNLDGCSCLVAHRGVHVLEITAV